MIFILTFGLHGEDTAPSFPTGGQAEVEGSTPEEPVDADPAPPGGTGAIVVAPTPPGGGGAVIDEPLPPPDPPPEPEPDVTPPSAPAGGSAVDIRPRPPGGGSAEELP